MDQSGSIMVLLYMGISYMTEMSAAAGFFPVVIVKASRLSIAPAGETADQAQGGHPLALGLYSSEIDRTA